MGSRTAAAAIFGFIFAIIFSGISLVTPSVINKSCNSQQLTERNYVVFGATFFSFTIGDVRSCPEEIVVGKNIGVPYATKTQPMLADGTEAGPITFQPSGLLFNMLIYWIAGFIFFLIFSPLRMNMHGKKARRAGKNIHRY